MNYIKLINHFWKTQHLKDFTAYEAYLYYYLLHECNLRQWENPFQCSNRSISAAIGISEKTLIDVRNRLKQKGMIDYKAGKRRKSSPAYTLLLPDTQKTKVSKRAGVKPDSNIGANNKTRENKGVAPSVLLLKECRDILLKDAQYLSVLCSNHGMHLTTVEEYMKSFFRKLENESVQYKDIADAKSHFARWLNIQITHYGSDKKYCTAKQAILSTSHTKDYGAT